MTLRLFDICECVLLSVLRMDGCQCLWVCFSFRMGRGRFQWQNYGKAKLEMGGSRRETSARYSRATSSPFKGWLPFRGSLSRPAPIRAQFHPRQPNNPESIYPRKESRDIRKRGIPPKPLAALNNIRNFICIFRFESINMIFFLSYRNVNKLWRFTN